ncbi:MAG: MtnX-like HAD-IB family phosphatase [Candidatus Odinarchaeota archaeon]
MQGILASTSNEALEDQGIIYCKKSGQSLKCFEEIELPCQLQDLPTPLYQGDNSDSLLKVSSIAARKTPLVSIWTDFDGTITRTDFGHIIIKNYGMDWNEFLTIEERVRSGHLSLREGLIKDYDLVRMTEQQLFDLAREYVEVDSHFAEFLSFARAQDMPVTILSDGFKQYIEFILKENGIAVDGNDIKANEVTFHEANVLKLSFPHVFSCSNCANCKRSHLEEFRERNRGCLLVYIGDGISDIYGSRAADHVFARKGSFLEKYFKNRGFAYHNFEDFRDVLQGMKVLLEKEREQPGFFEQMIDNRQKIPFPCEFEVF